MLESIDQLIDEVVSVVEATCGTQGVSKKDISKKQDNSFVTELDLGLSRKIKSFFSQDEKFKDWNFYCEEDHGELSFPAIVLDPIDGTRELVKGLGECAVSLALMPTPELSEGFGLIFNPFTGMLIHTDQPFVAPSKVLEPPLVGLVSRSEWGKGYYQGFIVDEVNLIPRGSIAFKLGLLAVGSCDFVYSMRPKNIWDIAAGSILLNNRGFNFYDSKGNKVSSLGTKKYDGPMMWAKEETYTRVIDQLG
ncbi:MAG: hypothetical protein KC493_03300 [Bacteriovoracaceae bacterium]|nr:hypothetical protein [Bacteriovoracaceae bacterium]